MSPRTLTPQKLQPDERPVIEISVELNETLSDYPTRSETMNSFDLLRQDMALLRAEMRAIFDEQEQRAKEREQRYVIITIGAIALSTTIISLLLAFP